MQTQYAKVENGSVTSTNLPTTGVLENGCTVSGYNKLSKEELKKEGWLSLEESIPIYNEEIEYIRFDRYDVQEDKVIMIYVVETKELPSLNILKSNKIQELKEICNQTIISGFEYNGEHYNLDYEDQINIGETKNNLIMGLITECEYYPSGQTCRKYTKEEFLGLYQTGMIFKATNIKRCKLLIEQVELCESKESIELIMW